MDGRPERLRPEGVDADEPQVAEAGVLHGPGDEPDVLVVFRTGEDDGEPAASDAVLVPFPVREPHGLIILKDARPRPKELPGHDTKSGDSFMSGIPRVRGPDVSGPGPSA